MTNTPKSIPKAIPTTVRVLDKWCQVHCKSIESSRETIILWNDFSPHQDIQTIISLPGYIEANSDRLRSKFVLFIDSIPDIVPSRSDRSIAQLLSLDDGFSLWWMNILSEKCNFSKSPWITDALKLIALLEIISRDKFEICMLDLRLRNIDLVLIIKDIAASNNIRCLSSISLVNLSIHQLLRAVGSFGAQFRLMLRASAWFTKYFLQARYFSAHTRSFHRSRQPSVTIFSYLTRRHDFLTSGSPIDPYWHSLPENIHARNY